MNLKQLTYVLAVAEEQSFTRAAQRCHIVQSALSHQIAKLEEELGCELFNRTSRQVKLTPAGQAIIAPTRKVLDSLQHLIDEVAASNNQISGKLTIGTISTLNAIDLAALLYQFHQRYPQVNIRLYVGMSENLMTDIQQQKTDIAFTGIWPGEKRILSLPHQQIADEPLVALLSPSHALAKMKQVTLQTLAGESLVDYCAGCGARQQTDRAFQAAGIKRHVSFEIDHIEWLENLVRQGLAIGIVPISTAQRLHSLISIPIKEEPRRKVHCVWGPSPSKAAECFLQLMQEAIAEQNTAASDDTPSNAMNE
ncbi:LysR family transcriptional regulator [Pragia fontium]|uniref:DNA-binding transcriptional regulator, LysR family n=1 Tax=Pragia fontium DSM 5563 = ATCC 49100 TaxID=1122977 RepID=A0AAJ4W8H5_9GAMM|nr:LysR family transcriptional regulator [Pragia fontium]SFC17657.1 DNA-binding transcriptional regulator, LysR family [Pragia fontium DSM 5563 = ATCC 49100]VEJ53331.1 Morphology and auto-aggregation control protein [Pragia fontium]